MARIHNYLVLRHLRSEANFHVIRYRGGRIRRAGRGLAFWFRPEGASIAEIPMDDRDMAFLFKGRTKDFQEATVQGVITWRVADPTILHERVDFTVDLDTGLYLREPLDQIATMMTGLARQEANGYLTEHSIDHLLEHGLGPIQARIEQCLVDSERLNAMGLEVVTVRLADISPSTELDRALRTPTFEALQQKADQATFERRAMAVEKERAISENELQNQIELARRTAQLIEQEDENARNQARGESEAKQIAADGEAGRIRAVEQARADMERARIDIYRDLPPHVLMGLAAREFAGKLKAIEIEHLNITPDMLGNVLSDLAAAAARRLDHVPEDRR